MSEGDLDAMTPEQIRDCIAQVSRLRGQPQARRKAARKDTVEHRTGKKATGLLDDFA